MDVKYSPIDGGEDFFRTNHIMENGLTPVDSQPQLILDNEKAEKDRERRRTISVNSVTQTANGSIVKLPRLHIPGETGELVGLAAELGNGSDQDSTDGGQLATTIAPEKLKQVYAQVVQLYCYQTTTSEESFEL